LLLLKRANLSHKELESAGSVGSIFKAIGEHEGWPSHLSTRDLRGRQEMVDGREVSVDGVVSKRLDQPYQPGERAMLKVKCLRSALLVGASRMSRQPLCRIAAARPL